MYTEYCNYNRVIYDYSKELSLVYRSMDLGMKGMSIPIHMYREIKEYLPEGFVVSCPIDYPCGHSSTKARNFMVLNYAKSGVNAIDYTPNHYLMKTSPVKALKEIKTALSICRDYGVTLRIFIDSDSKLNYANLCKLYYSIGIDICFPCVAYHRESFFDTVINAKLIQKNTEMSIIYNGFLWHEQQAGIIKRAEFFGLRVYDLEFWCNYLDKE